MEYRGIQLGVMLTRVKHTVIFFPLECGYFAFHCDNGQCIDYDLKCNGYTDCSDGSDEDDCSDFRKWFVVWMNGWVLATPFYSGRVGSTQGSC